MKGIFNDSKDAYGYRRIIEGLLQKYGVTMNGRKVFKIMKKYNLMDNYIRKVKKKHKNGRMKENIKPNLLKRNFTVDISNKVWNTDITYLMLKEKGTYLSTIIDLYDRYIVHIKYDNKLVMDYFK